MCHEWDLFLEVVQKLFIKNSPITDRFVLKAGHTGERSPQQWDVLLTYARLIVHTH